MLTSGSFLVLHNVSMNGYLFIVHPPFFLCRVTWQLEPVPAETSKRFLFLVFMLLFSSDQVVVVSKMERLMASQQGIQQLEEFQFGVEGRKFPLCHSWTTKEFG